MPVPSIDVTTVLVSMIGGVCLVLAQWVAQTPTRRKTKEIHEQIKPVEGNGEKNIPAELHEIRSDVAVLTRYLLRHTSDEHGPPLYTRRWDDREPEQREDRRRPPGH